MVSPGAAQANAEVAPDAAPPVPAFPQLYEEYFTFVWTSARRLGVPAASIDDAVQEAFVVVHRRLGEFAGRSSLKTWLFAIVRNVARETRRSIRRKSPHDAPGALEDPEALAGSPEDRPDHAAERSSENRVLHALLDKLDDDKREVFVLAELEGFAAPEIAEAIGINVNTVYSRLRHAREEFAAAAARYRARVKEMESAR
jgi:RNA polymerase sigma-70 factor (ECF subfamily)